MSNVEQFLLRAVEDPRNGWSIGTFGAIGEFVRDAAEPVRRGRERGRSDGIAKIVTPRGGMCLASCDGLRILAYETLASDGESWGNAVAFCLPAAASRPSSVIRRLGPDANALRPEDRGAILYDLGIGVGHVSMCVRTGDRPLQESLDRAEGETLLGPGGKEAAELVRLSGPNRVMLSPAGRIEVYAAIPAADGKSPEGPHTHLLPKLIAVGRTHSANAPIPDGLQPVLMLHPPSPWRDAKGKRKPFDAPMADAFADILAAYGLEDDRAVSAAVESAVRDGMEPRSFSPPASRRGRAQMRIALRRLAMRLDEKILAPWRELYDSISIETEEAAHAHG